MLEESPFVVGHAETDDAGFRMILIGLDDGPKAGERVTAIVISNEDDVSRSLFEGIVAIGGKSGGGEDGELYVRTVGDF